MKQAFLEAGRILTTHATLGEVKFEHWGDSPEGAMRVHTFYRTADGKQPLVVRSCRRHGKFLLLAFEGVGDIDSAALLRGRILYAKRADFDPSGKAIFWADLIGTPVTDARTGEVYGVIRDIVNRGASDLWEIEQGDTRTLFPAAPAFVESLDPEQGARILPPEGLFHP